MKPYDEEWEDYEDDMLYTADVSLPEKAIGILRALYLDERNGEERKAYQMEIANDSECISFFIDYWEFVRLTEHGNTPSISEIGFGGFVNMILFPKEYLDYLSDIGGREAENLEKRLIALHGKYRLYTIRRVPNPPNFGSKNIRKNRLKIKRR